MAENSLGFPRPTIELDRDLINETLTELTEQVEIHEALLTDAWKDGIKSENDEADAADRLKEVSDFLKNIEADRKAATEPFRTVVAEFNGLVKPIAHRAEGVKAKYKMLIGRWKDAQERLAREEQRRLREEEAKARRLAEEAAAAGDDTTAEIMETQAETAAAEAEVVPEVMAPKSSKPSYGRATGSKFWAYEIVNTDAIPRQYLMVNESALKMAAKMKPQPPAIPGIKWTEKRRITSR